MSTAVESWVLEFEGYPPSPNARLHWRTKARVTKHWRSTARLKAALAGIPQCPRVRISVVIIRRALGVADEDNDRARMKALVDGLRDAGVIENDTYGNVEWGTMREERGRKGLRVIVERLEALT